MRGCGGRGRGPSLPCSPRASGVPGSPAPLHGSLCLHHLLCLSRGLHTPQANRIKDPSCWDCAFSTRPEPCGPSGAGPHPCLWLLHSPPSFTVLNPGARSSLQLALHRRRPPCQHGLLWGLALPSWPILMSPMSTPWPAAPQMPSCHSFAQNAPVATSWVSRGT